MSIERQVVGTYLLRTFEDIADDGEIRYPLGERPRGVINYSPEGWMTAVLMAEGRRNFEEGDVLGGTADERAEAFLTASGYAGRWVVRDDMLVHHIEAATFPNWVGTEQRRPFTIAGDELRLFPPRLLMAGKWRRSELVWDKQPTIN